MLRNLCNVARPRLLVAFFMIGGMAGEKRVWPEERTPSQPTVEWTARLARRRAIAEVRKVPEAPGAYVEFFSAGLCEPNGQDISIFDEKGVRAPHLVMSVGPGDRFLITFKLSDAKAYYLYYGQPGATPSPQWNPECGVFLRTYRRPSGDSNTVAELETMVRSIRQMFGGGYRAAIFDGCNPYGPSDDYASVYTAYLKIPKAGSYSFATNSDDASALYLDGKLIADYPGIHQASATRGQRSGDVFLKEGVHVLSYYHVEYSGPQATTAAWKRPGEEFFTPIPMEAYVPISPCVVTAIEDRRGKVLDFSYEIDEIYVPEGAPPLIGVKFKPFSLTLGEKAQFLWDFGDGERSNEKSPTHIYLSERLSPATLTVQDEQNRRHSASHYVYSVHLEERSTTNPEKTRETFEDILRRYTCQRLTPDELETLHDFFAAGQDNEAQTSAVAAMLLKAVAVDQSERRAKFLLSWADANRKSNSGDVQNQRARCYEEAVRVTQNKRTKARALLDLGDVQFRFLGDSNAALSCYRTVANENADKELTRRAVISQGDVCLLSGDLATARRLYEQAGVLPEHERGAEALRTSYGNLIEGYIKQKEFDAAIEAIETWEWKYPMIKTRGYSLILRSRTAFALGNMGEVQKYTSCIIRTLEEESFKPEAYYLLISCLLRQGQNAVAAGHFQALKESYPRDPHVELLRRFFP